MPRKHQKRYNEQKLLLKILITVLSCVLVAAVIIFIVKPFGEKLAFARFEPITGIILEELSQHRFKLFAKNG